MAKLSALEFLAAQYGDKRFGAETLIGNFDGIYISQDNTEISIVLDHNGANITTELGLGAGELLSKGDVFRSAKKGISSITCDAGAGIAVYSNPKP